jgi:hypothetical protein
MSNVPTSSLRSAQTEAGTDPDNMLISKKSLDRFSSCPGTIDGTIPEISLLFRKRSSRLAALPKLSGMKPVRVLFEKYKNRIVGTSKILAGISPVNVLFE